MPAASPPRRVGFDRPLTTNQVASWIGNAFATGLFYGLVATVLLVPRRRCDEGTLAVLVIPHAVCVVVGLVNWLFLETHPPTQPSCFSALLPDSARWTKTRYCREHKDVIVGLDHFCTWLNVSVGRTNYVPFFLVAMFGTLQYALAAAACAYVVATCRRGLGALVLALFGLCGAMGLLICLAYLSLFLFHSYLACLGMGTYDWIIAQRAEPKAKSVELKAAANARVSADETEEEARA